MRRRITIAIIAIAALAGFTGVTASAAGAQVTASAPQTWLHG
jgi:uncharacterized membrane protein YtjA (UPF0391 family)